MEQTLALPPRLAEAVRQLVNEGWYSDEESLLVDAVRRLVGTHKPDLLERFVREDVEWGLYGED
jgi:Arc/MetJ-type ribon-helix-helix transcriptional regulator